MTEHLSHPKYRRDIDGLRAIAVLSVVAYHAFPYWIKGGFIGVDVFFVISGFLISTIIFENLEKGTFSFFEFYARRIRRIFPTLILILVACFAFGWFALFADEYKQLGKHIAGGAGFVSNFLFWNESGYFDNSADTKPLLHLWSLGVEEQFYIVWPLLLWFAHNRRFNLLSIGIIIAVISFYLNIRQVRTDAVAAFYSPQTRFWELMAGSLLAWVALYKPSFSSMTAGRPAIWLVKAERANDGVALVDAVSVFALLLLSYGFWKINKEIDALGQWVIVPVLGSVLIIFAGPKAWVNRTILSNRIAVWFGLISFPLYLWHWPLLSFASIVEGEFPARNIRVVAVVLSVLFAWLTYRLVERPLRFGKLGNAKVTALTALMAVVGYVGYTTYSRDGYEFRSSIRGYTNNNNELVRTPSIDDECLNYAELKNPRFLYCRFTNANSYRTVAVIGDSHAHVAYPGIAEYLKSKGVNTVLLADAWCPPFLDSKEVCRNGIEQILNVLSKHDDINRVFVFSRGPVYNTGTEPLSGNQNTIYSPVIPIGEFASSAQLTFDMLSKSGRSIFYVTENPELYYSAKSCVSRPFKSVVRNCSVEKGAILERQADYLNAFKNLKNVTVINSLDVFCPQNDCIVFDENGSILYADDDHLSVAGSNFQVQKLLKSFLD